ncbi:hypothetical protein [Rufibacter quisquiliarum]|uniref:Uncharacterized protein n=1 Tax=Rufibacter quisquiliarum TaxID=1549639 RepID=A0A839GPG3_9BACT|nr:hypothetical protein [Rufibacter quisquiliarum]MBA9079873.1 hypothetical protein [Rufibacter quisquiliarum]
MTGKSSKRELAKNMSGSYRPMASVSGAFLGNQSKNRNKDKATREAEARKQQRVTMAIRQLGFPPADVPSLPASG